jgi:protein TonB
MERPNHLEVAPGNAGSKVTGLVIVIAIHVLAIAGLVVALNQGAIMNQLKEIKATVDSETIPDKAPPPPPPPLENVPPPTAIVPEFSVATAAPPPSVTTAAPKPPAPPAPSGPSATKLEPIRSTFTLPPYPEVAKRLGEQGTTTLKINIGKDGRISACEVQTSSGSERLDQAAVEWVKARYRYRPPTENGQPVEATTLLRVVWNLKNAG